MRIGPFFKKQTIELIELRMEQTIEYKEYVQNSLILSYYKKDEIKLF